MAKRLRFSRIQAVERRGALMLVWFLDDEGTMYSWCPKWREVEKVFLNQIDVERFNKPESEWLNRFGRTVQQVVEGAQKIESATKLYGKFQRYEEQKLIIHGEKEMVSPQDMVFGDFFGASAKPRLVPVKWKLIPGFEVTFDFLDQWIGRDVEVFIINNIAIRLRQYDEGYNAVIREYPEL